MRFLALIFVNLRRHYLRALIGVAGIGFGVAAMLTILSIVHGAIGMFERILAVDSHYLVFEKNVLSADGRMLEVRCGGMREGFVHEVMLPELRSKTGADLWHRDAYYTLNKRPEK